jgi:hypothetical protein
VILLSKFTQGVHPVRLALQEVLHRSTIETELSTIACVFVTEGLGVAIVDRFTASEFVGRGLVVRRFEPAALIGCAIIQSSTRKLSLLAEEFRTVFLDHVDAFLRQDVNAPVQMARLGGADPSHLTSRPRSSKCNGGLSHAERRKAVRFFTNSEEPGGLDLRDLR